MKGLDECQEDIVDKWAPRAGARVYFDQDEDFWVNLQNRIPHRAQLDWLGIGSRRHVSLSLKSVYLLFGSVVKCTIQSGKGFVWSHYDVDPELILSRGYVQ